MLIRRQKKVMYENKRENVVSECGTGISEAISLDNEAMGGIEAAQAEQESGRPAISLGLLKDSIEKERASLDLLSEGVETLRQSLEQRRQALDEEAEILEQVIRDLTEERR